MNNIQIDVQWIPRDANVRADLLSCFVDKDDWSLNCEIFAQLDSRWGLHCVDRFASHYNTQLRRFNSRFLSPGYCTVDGLSQDWHDENNCLCPPVSIIVDVIRHAHARLAHSSLLNGCPLFSGLCRTLTLPDLLHLLWISYACPEDLI